MEIQTLMLLLISISFKALKESLRVFYASEYTVALYSILYRDERYFENDDQLAGSPLDSPETEACSRAGCTLHSCVLVLYRTAAHSWPWRTTPADELGLHNIACAVLLSRAHEVIQNCYPQWHNVDAFRSEVSRE